MVVQRRKDRRHRCKQRLWKRGGESLSKIALKFDISVSKNVITFNQRDAAKCHRGLFSIDSHKKHPSAFIDALWRAAPNRGGFVWPHINLETLDVGALHRWVLPLGGTVEVLSVPRRDRNRRGLFEHRCVWHRRGIWARCAHVHF